MPATCTVMQGRSPLILSLPHAGTQLPDDIQPSLHSVWRACKDADWHLQNLYGFARELGATLIVNMISRSVIDVNRDPSGASLYPGQATTGLCPLETFDGEALYLPGMAPDEAEIMRRKTSYFETYHRSIAQEIYRLRERHKSVTLYDCHSIRSKIPRLFEGELPILNIGTNSGKSCDAQTAGRAAKICKASGLSWVENGRFKGGYITRHYGNPARGVNAIQMELACRGYMVEPECPTPENWPGRILDAPPVLPVLRDIIESLLT